MVSHGHNLLGRDIFNVVDKGLCGDSEQGLWRCGKLSFLLFALFENHEFVIDDEDVV